MQPVPSLPPKRPFHLNTPCHPSNIIQGPPQLQAPPHGYTNIDGGNSQLLITPATPTHPQGGPIFMNAVPNQCTWMPTQPIIVRQMPPIIQTPLFRQGISSSQPPPVY